VYIYTYDDYYVCVSGNDGKYEPLLHLATFQSCEDNVSPLVKSGDLSVECDKKVVAALSRAMMDGLYHIETQKKKELGSYERVRLIRSPPCQTGWDF
jgi:hypothetical protein